MPTSAAIPMPLISSYTTVEMCFDYNGIANDFDSIVGASQVSLSLRVGTVSNT